MNLVKGMDLQIGTQDWMSKDLTLKVQQFSEACVAADQAVEAAKARPDLSELSAEELADFSLGKSKQLVSALLRVRGLFSMRDAVVADHRSERLLLAGKLRSEAGSLVIKIEKTLAPLRVQKWVLETATGSRAPCVLELIQRAGQLESDCASGSLKVPSHVLSRLDEKILRLSGQAE